MLILRQLPRLRLLQNAESQAPYPTELESFSSPGDFMQIKIEEALVWKSDSLKQRLPHQNHLGNKFENEAEVQVPSSK